MLLLTDGSGTATVACEAVLLDLDGTLVDSRECVERKWRAWCARHRLNADELLGYSHGRPQADTVRRMAPHLDPVAEEAELTRWEEDDTTGLRAIPGAAELLAAIPAGRWAVVTSAWRRLAEIRMSHVGLPTPSVLVTADDVDHGKPAPDGYRAAAAQLGWPEPDCVVVEDSPVGVLAGRVAGMRVIAVATTLPRDSLDGDWVIGDLTSVRYSATRCADPSR